MSNDKNFCCGLNASAIVNEANDFSQIEYSECCEKQTNDLILSIDWNKDYEHEAFEAFLREKN